MGIRNLGYRRVVKELIYVEGVFFLWGMDVGMEYVSFIWV